MKTVIVLAILVVAACAAPELRELCTSKTAHDFIDCPDDSKETLLKTTVTAESSLFQVQTVTYRSPTLIPGKKVKISCVKVIDQIGNNVGGCPFLISGGSGSSEVTLKLISQRSRGFNFYITIQGA